MPHPAKADESVLSRELEYHEKLYSGFAQSHFARPAVRAFREHLVERIVRLTNVTKTSRVLSLGCGIGDTELMLARHASELVGVDLSPTAVKQAQSDATRLGITNVHFIHGNNPPADSGSFDVVIGVFFLHHLSDDALCRLPERVSSCTAPGSRFYALDPSDRRLSGAVGRRLFPKLMKKYETADERELNAHAVAELFRSGGFQVTNSIYDFGSSPLAGLFPGWRWGYRFSRQLDNLLLQIPALSARGSNFEILAERVSLRP